MANSAFTFSKRTEHLTRNIMRLEETRNECLDLKQQIMQPPQLRMFYPFVDYESTGVGRYASSAKDVPPTSFHTVDFQTGNTR